MLPALIVTASLAATAHADLVAAASASGRPRECWPARPSDRASRSNIWTQARSPGLSQYCALIARGQARVTSDPVAAQAAASQADQARPGHAAPLVIKARAALRLGELDDARMLFNRALAIDPRSVEQPAALHDLATLLRLSDRLPEALRTYRVLVPRATLLGSREARALVLLEAAHVSMAVVPERSGPARLDEALAYLREAGQDPHHSYRVDVALSLALALDRAGHAHQADAVLAELRGAVWWAEQRPVRYLARKVDELALRALALHSRRPAQAARLWQRYLTDASATDPWRAAAQARLQRLGRAEPRSRRRRPR